MHGIENERCDPFAAHPSANIPLAAEAALDVVRMKEGRAAELARSAELWWSHLEPGVSGVMMRHEFGSSIYSPWIVCPIATAARVHAGNDAGRRARLWVRAWAVLATLTLGWRMGRLISDEDDPPGTYRPGPVFATAREDRWNGRVMRRQRSGLLPSVMVGERSWNRSWQGDDEWRLMRGFLDQSSTAGLIQLALEIPYATDTSPEGDWEARYALGVEMTWGGGTPVLPLERGEVEVLRGLFSDRSPERVREVLPWLEGWVPDREYVIGCTSSGLWMLSKSGGRTSTAPTYAAVWEDGGRQGWLACDDGRRKSGGAPDAIAAGRGWEEGQLLRCERSDGLYGVREIEKPGGEERWRLEFGPLGYELVTPNPASPPVAPPVAPSAGGRKKKSSSRDAAVGVGLVALLGALLSKLFRKGGGGE